MPMGGPHEGPKTSAGSERCSVFLFPCCIPARPASETESEGPSARVASSLPMDHEQRNVGPAPPSDDACVCRSSTNALFCSLAFLGHIPEPPTHLGVATRAAAMNWMTFMSVCGVGGSESLGDKKKEKGNVCVR